MGWCWVVWAVGLRRVFGTLLFIWQLHGLLMGRWGCSAEKGIWDFAVHMAAAWVADGSLGCSAEKGLWDFAVHMAAAWLADGSLGL